MLFSEGEAREKNPIVANYLTNSEDAGAFMDASSDSLSIYLPASQ
jgi:hypothetical protein